MLEKARPLVLDTSVAAKWFMNEPDSEKAALVLDQVVKGRWQLTAPELLRYELAHVFWKRRRLGYHRGQCELALNELKLLGLQEAPTASLFPRALEIAYSLEIAVYDACYVALAQALKGSLATFDKELIKRVEKRSAIPIITFE